MLLSIPVISSISGAQVRARFWALTWARNASLEPRVYRLALERQYSENAFVYSTQRFLMDEPF